MDCMTSTNKKATNPALAAAALVGIAGFVCGAPSPVSAEVTWQNGLPVFGAGSDGGARASARRRYSSRMDGGGRPRITPVAPPTIDLAGSVEPGVVIIDTAARKLYLTLPQGRALAYPISVGREGFKWYGSEKISRVQSWPSWTPPPEMRRRQPYLPMTMTGGVRNPLGAKALYLGNTLYRIHGTNEPKSIGRASSSGCFRMMNHHVLHLAENVAIGATVHVVRKWTGVLPAAVVRDEAAPGPNVSGAPAAENGSATRAASEALAVPPRGATADAPGDASTHKADAAGTGTEAESGPAPEAVPAATLDERS
jgi:lipoprotein-anchoring transpeptidase ErfK/SrfK